MLSFLAGAQRLNHFMVDVIHPSAASALASPPASPPFSFSSPLLVLGLGNDDDEEEEGSGPASSVCVCVCVCVCVFPGRACALCVNHLMLMLMMVLKEVVQLRAIMIQRAVRGGALALGHVAGLLLVFPSRGLVVGVGVGKRVLSILPGWQMLSLRLLLLLLLSLRLRMSHQCPLVDEA